MNQPLNPQLACQDSIFVRSDGTTLMCSLPVGHLGSHATDGAQWTDAEHFGEPGIGLPDPTVLESEFTS